jgi:hypothetical protein
MNHLLTYIHTDMKRIVYNMLCMTILSLLASCVEQEFENIVLKEVKASICDFDHESENITRTSYSLGESGYEARHGSEPGLLSPTDGSNPHSINRMKAADRLVSGFSDDEKDMWRAGEARNGLKIRGIPGSAP